MIITNHNNKINLKSMNSILQFKIQIVSISESVSFTIQKCFFDLINSMFTKSPKVFSTFGYALRRQWHNVRFLVFLCLINYVQHNVQDEWRCDEGDGYSVVNEICEVRSVFGIE